MKHIITIITIACVIGCSSCHSNQQAVYSLLVGTYTDTIHPEGIHVYDFDPLTGNLAFRSSVQGIENPSYLAVNQNGTHVYAVSEVDEGGVVSFGFHKETGALAYMNRVSSGGSRPAYISTDQENRFAFAANYGSGSLSAIPIREDGSLGPPVQTIQHEGSSINVRRQAAPHVHCVIPTPDNQFVMTADLGTDKVNIYRYDPGNSDQPLIPAGQTFVTVLPGSGPRHIDFHLGSGTAYLISEMAGDITAFEYDNGQLTEKQRVTMLSSGYEGQVSAADIHVSPDGRYLYGSNRGSANEIVIFAIGEDGMLEYAGRQSVLGERPRNFTLDPTGRFLLVANQNSNEIVVFSRDPESGMLTPTEKRITVNSPVCLKFVP